jgi:hypothetical protein
MVAADEKGDSGWRVGSLGDALGRVRVVGGPRLLESGQTHGDGAEIAGYQPASEDVYRGSGSRSFCGGRVGFAGVLGGVSKICSAKMPRGSRDSVRAALQKVPSALGFTTE